MTNPILDQERFELIEARPKQGTVEVPAWPRPEKHLPRTDLETSWVCFSTLNHRTRAEQESMKLSSDAPGMFTDDPLGKVAQEAQYQILTSQEGFTQLLEDLRSRGQQDPAIVTADGVLINGNRRAAALRYLYETEDNRDARYIKCLVLPSDAKQTELVDLETELQIARDFKEAYSWINEAILIADIYEREGRDFDRVASRMHREVSDIRSKYRNLQYATELVSMSNGHKHYLDFQDNESAFTELAKHLQRTTGPEAEDIKNAYFLGILSGTQYRRLRHLRRADAGELILSEVNDDPTLRAVLEVSSSEVEDGESDPLDIALGDKVAPSKLTGLVSLVASLEAEGNMALPSGEKIEVEDLRYSLDSAIRAATVEAEEDSRDQVALETPISRMNKARSEVERAITALPKARVFPEFDENEFRKLVEDLIGRLSGYVEGKL